MDIGWIIRAADALMTTLLWLIAATGILAVAATNQYLALAVAMAVALECYAQIRRVMDPKP